MVRSWPIPEIAYAPMQMDFYEPKRNSVRPLRPHRTIDFPYQDETALQRLPTCIHRLFSGCLRHLPPVTGGKLDQFSA
jgi:hypothetical protein